MLLNRSPMIHSTTRRQGLSTSAAVGTATAAATTNDSQSLYLWGTNSKGTIPGIDRPLLDVPTEIDWKKACQVDEDEGVSIRKIVCGPTDTAMVLSDGRCFLSGMNKQGQLGLGHKNPVEVPTLLNDINVESIYLGQNFSALVKSDGELYTFGYGGSVLSGLGTLGHGNGESYLEPKLVESLVEDGCFAKDVQIGESHMTVLTTEGEVLTCGGGSYGRLGSFDAVDQLYLAPVELLSSDVVQIAGGKSFTLALTSDGVVHGWGRNHKGQLGTGLGMAVDMYAMESIPAPIESGQLEGLQVTKIAAGHSHAACIVDSGRLFFWGMTLHLEPELVTSLLHTKIVDVACGENYTIALGEDGNLYSMGQGKTGALGQASVKQLNQAQLIESLVDKSVLSMSAGWKHVACLVE